MASFLYRKNRDVLQPFILLLAMGILFLVITVPLIFSNQWITVFWTAQAVALLWASIRLKNIWFCGGALVLLFLAATKFFGNDYTQIFHLEADGLHRAANDFGDHRIHRRVFGQAGSRGSELVKISLHELLLYR